MIGAGIGSDLLHARFAKNGIPPASKVAREALPLLEAEEEGSECVICLEEWETGKEGALWAQVPWGSA